MGEKFYDVVDNWLSIHWHQRLRDVVRGRAQAGPSSAAKQNNGQIADFRLHGDGFSRPVEASLTI